MNKHPREAIESCNTTAIRPAIGDSFNARRAAT